MPIIIKKGNKNTLKIENKLEEIKKDETKIIVRKTEKVEDIKKEESKILVRKTEEVEDNKTIYLTYKKEIPNLVFDRWKQYNKGYNIEFSLDEECILFLNQKFNRNIANLFKRMKRGSHKSDLWRLCKLYINSGVYADVDIVPFLDIDSLEDDVTFYSCISPISNSIFQAFIVNKSKPKNKLILSFIISFLVNKPYHYPLGPTFDMYSLIKYNLGVNKLIHDKKYKLDRVKIPIKVGTSRFSRKVINLFYFPSDIEYSINVISSIDSKKFKFEINDSLLNIYRIDKDEGWVNNLHIDICLKSNEVIYLFQEKMSKTKDKPLLCCYYVAYKDKKILDSRDVNYYKNGGW